MLSDVMVATTMMLPVWRYAKYCSVECCCCCSRLIGESRTFACMYTGQTRERRNDHARCCWEFVPVARGGFCTRACQQQPDRKNRRERKSGCLVAHLTIIIACPQLHQPTQGEIYLKGQVGWVATGRQQRKELLLVGK